MGLVEKVTNDAAQRMPDKFTAAEEVMAFPSEWTWNLYNNESVKLEPSSFQQYFIRLPISSHKFLR